MYNLKKIGLLQELIILILFILLINNYFGNKRPVILADGQGYYEYLPAIFIYNNLNFNYTDTLISQYYEHKISSKGYLPVIEDKRVNKYFVGTALAQSPFFLLAHWIASANPDLNADGYSLIYQDFIFYAALFYLLLGLFFLRKLLKLQKIPLQYIFAIQLAILFASSLMYYAVRLPSFSHVYSFAFVNIFLFLIVKYSKTNHNRILYFAATILGIIVLIRPVNILIVLFIPFLFPDPGSFKLAFSKLFTYKKKAIAVSALIILLLIGIQPLIWYLQTGAFFIKSYQYEGLILTQPHVLKFLFSYQKGFFVYAPVFFLLLTMGTIHYMQNRNIWKLLSFYLPFLVTVYVLSSWWVWYYGSSFGSRVMIDYYGVIAVFGSTVFIHKRKLIKIITTILFGCFAFLAIIQTYQYDHFIIHWDGMSKERYWKIFLKTEDKYKGLFWHTKPNVNEKSLVNEKTISDYQLLNPTLNSSVLLSRICFDNTSGQHKNLIVQLEFETKFEKGIDKFLLVVDNYDGNTEFYSEKYLFYGTQENNFEGKSEMFFEIKGLADMNSCLQLYFHKHESKSKLSQVRIRLYKN